MLRRDNTNMFSILWWQIDRHLVFLILTISSVGLMLLAASSPLIARKIGFNAFYFVKKQIVHFGAGIAIMFFIANLNYKKRQYFVYAGFTISFVLLICAFFSGIGYKGARRWLSIFGFSLQPSEFVKVFLAAFCSIQISKWHKCIQFHNDKIIKNYRNQKYPGHILTIVATSICVGIIIMQPDIAMAINILADIMLLFFLSGIPLYWCGIFTGSLFLSLVTAYYTFNHAKMRIDNFLNYKNLDPWGVGYQITKSLKAIAKGGLFGAGIGEGVIKNYLPDSHADFIFAVAVEEMGIIFCVIILILFSLIVWRSFKIATSRDNLTDALMVATLTGLFALQFTINIAANIRLIPTTGVTLPFISYGGSSVLSTFILMGLILSCSKNK